MSALVLPNDLPPPPEPITVEQAIRDLLSLVSRIRQRLHALINYYIYPDLTPTAVSEYDPRLHILQDRLQALSRLSYQKLPYIIGKSDDITGYYLNQVAEQMQNSVRGIERIFTSHYNPDLEDPFRAIWEGLTYKKSQIAELGRRSPSNPRRLRAEDMRPNELGNFCNGALQISNGVDRGRISFVETRELTEDNRRKLRVSGGAFLAWQCPECSYRVRYHVTSSNTSNIHHTDEIRRHNGLAIQYRSKFLARSHLYLPPPGTTTTRVIDRRRRNSNVLIPPRFKYGCIFCFAFGYDLLHDRRAFTTPQALAEHIVLCHRRSTLPTMLLHLYAVAIDDKMDEPHKKWEVNIL
ncbi:hypothetical protein EDD36DRAFT_44168 [Exophiala viscosa]|uniref:C2H2-type domain-containing protein n=1 Tax=Exophiala viscosa TaxID=2486360 RepID=A0AAN6II21_9EURO|nr:hypothetical protein EDD36DRAFT_44168 [Exophiala viscosa]